MLAVSRVGKMLEHVDKYSYASGEVLCVVEI